METLKIEKIKPITAFDLNQALFWGRFRNVVTNVKHMMGIKEMKQ